MDRKALAEQIEFETRKRLLSENAEAFTIFRSCINFRPETLSVELTADHNLYGTDATASFNGQLQNVHSAIKKEMQKKYGELL